MNVQKFYVEGMACAACQGHVHDAVAALDGVSEVAVNLLTKEMLVQFDERKVTEKSICKAVRKLGFSISPAAEKDPAAEDRKLCRALLFRFVCSLIFLLPLMYLAMPHFPKPDSLNGSPAAVSLLQFFLLLPILYLNRNYFRNGFARLWHRKPDMESLIALGSGAGVLYGMAVTVQILRNDSGALLTDLSFEAAGMILTIVTLGKFLEMRSRGKTGDAIAKLMALAPKTASVERDGREVMCPVSDLKAGDIVVLRSGSAVPADGIVVSGYASLDQSAITGESVPVEKMPDMPVISGSLCTDGLLKFRVEKTGADTTLEKIIQCVRNAAAGKAPVSRLADRVSAVFVPVVILISLITFAVWILLTGDFGTSLTCAVAVLVISCPCALGLATPVAIMTGTGRGAELGILFRNAAALEMLHKTGVAVFDKTGTLTSGEPAVSRVFCSDGTGQNELLSAAASLEQASQHPYAAAVCRYAESAGIRPAEINGFKILPGQGICGISGDQELAAGNVALLRSLNVENPALEKQAGELADAGMTPLFFLRNRKILGLLGISDTLRPGSAEAVRLLEKMKIRTVLLTGDNRRTADAAARELQIGSDSVYADVLPEEKESIIRREQEQTGKAVAMIGDGINDAPALARADVGIAIGAGTDVALETADVVLAKSDPRGAVDAIRLSRAVMVNIRMNLFWGLFYNIIGIPFAAGVFYPLTGWFLPPMFGAAAMSLSSVCVVLNALRLRKFQ